MMKPSRPFLAVSVVSACAFLLSACGGGSSGGSTPPPSSPITASATIPTSADAGTTFNVNVSLTATNPSSSTASVQVVDVGSVTPQIDCGQPQSVTINGSGKSFTCHAPQANLGSSNTHQLQVDVNGAGNLSQPVSVNVLNGGRVDVQLTSPAGTVITAAAPGKTVEVALSTTTTPAGTGQYTVTAPSGWQVGNGGVCNISSTSTSCKVPVTVASGAANGPYDIVIGAELGSSSITPATLPISVQSQTPTSDMAFDLAQNISDTLYADSSSKVFTYQPVFLFKNTTGSNLAISSVSVSGLSNVTYGCNIAQPLQQANYTLNGTQSCSLAPYSATNKGPVYAVSGTLNNSNPGTLPAASSISISIMGSGKTYVQHDMQVTFVKYVPGHVAVNVVNNSSDTVYAAGVYGPYMVNFDSSNVGTTGTDQSSTDFQKDQIALTSAGGVLYMPYGSSGEVYLTRGSGGFNTNAVPSPTGSPQPPAFLQFELTYGNNETLTVDQTYVNFISMLGSFNLMGNTAPLALQTEASTHGTVTSLTQAQVYQNVENFFDAQGAPWKYVSANGQKNYIQKDSNSNITSILAPIQVYGTSFDPMPNTYYDTYINALWTYLQTTPIYVDASGTGKSDFTQTTSDNCVLKGQVVPSSSTSANAGKLVFSVASGTCPAQGYSIGAPYNGNYCGYTSGNQPANLACADTPDLVFAKFNECDLLNAAGSAACHEVVDPTSSTNSNPQPIDTATFFENENLWGPNGTYRAVVGRAIAAYQAIGLLPPCANPAEVMNATNARSDIGSGHGFANPSCLSGLGSSPTWNVYAAALRPYVDVYAYSYGDFLGLDGTVTFSLPALPSTLQQDLQTAQPVTITLH